MKFKKQNKMKINCTKIFYKKKFDIKYPYGLKIKINEIKMCEFI